MMNQLYTGTPSSRRNIALPSSVLAGDFVLVGQIPAVALDAYQSVVLGATVLTNGSFNLFVISRLANSPLVNTSIKPGDKLYASGGTLDATTNVRYGMTIDANPSGTFIGFYDPTQAAMTSGAGATVGVLLGVLGA
jgi:predicted RecA/RadA family phage recombinase